MFCFFAAPTFSLSHFFTDSVIRFGKFFTLFRMDVFKIIYRRIVPFYPNALKNQQIVNMDSKNRANVHGGGCKVLQFCMNNSCDT